MEPILVPWKSSSAEASAWERMQLCKLQEHLNDSSTDGSFTMANSNLFLCP